MAKFCGYCGTPVAGTPYCPGCGHPTEQVTSLSPQVAPVAQPDPTVSASVASVAPVAPVAPEVRAYPAAHPGREVTAPRPAAPAAPRRPTANPFALTPPTDYARDAGALVCLFAVLAMPWDLQGDAADRWWVVLGVLVAVLAVPLPYVGRSLVVPGLTALHVRLAKTALAVPLALGVGAALVNELINLDDLAAGGLGSGVSMAVAGVLLTVQPRRNDESSDPRGGRGWLLAASAAAVAAAVAVPLAFLAFLLDDLLGARFVVSDVLLVATTLVVTVGTLVVAVAWPALASLGAGAAWPRVLATTGFATLAVLLVGQGDALGFPGEVEKWSSPTGGGLLLAAAAALAVARPVHAEAARRRDPATDWVATAAAALAVSALLAGTGAVSLVLYTLQVDQVVASVVVVVVLLVASAVALTVAGALVGATPRGRVAVLVLVSSQALLVVVALSVSAAEDVPFPATAVLAGALLALPVLALVALTLPPTVRAAYGPVVAPQQLATPTYR